MPSLTENVWPVPTPEVETFANIGETSLVLIVSPETKGSPKICLTIIVIGSPVPGSALCIEMTSALFESSVEKIVLPSNCVTSTSVVTKVESRFK